MAVPGSQCWSADSGLMLGVSEFVSLRTIRDVTLHVFICSFFNVKFNVMWFYRTLFVTAAEIHVSTPVRATAVNHSLSFGFRPVVDIIIC